MESSNIQISQITQDELDRLVAGKRFKPETRKIMREIFVLGRNRLEVADEYGLSRQRIHLIIRTFQDLFAQHSEPASNALVSISYTQVPKPLAIELERFLHAIKTCKDKQKKDALINDIRDFVNKSIDALRSERT